MAEFGLDKPMWQQFFIYVNNVFHGNLVPLRAVSGVGQLPDRPGAAVEPRADDASHPIGWIVGNILGAVAAFRGGWVDRGAFVGSLFLSSVPPFALGITCSSCSR